MRRVVAAAGVLLIALGLAGCGDDGGDSADSPGTTAAAASGGAGGSVDVIAKDIEFDKTEYSTSGGTVEVSYVNEGSITHTLLIEDVDGFKLEVAAKGDEDEGTVDLEAGTYTLYCDVPGHREAGMEATLEVS